MSADSPIYIEISPLLASPLAGIGRFVARLIEALSRLKPLHVVNLADSDLTARLTISLRSSFHGRMFPKYAISLVDSLLRLRNYATKPLRFQNRPKLMPPGCARYQTRR